MIPPVAAALGAAKSPVTVAVAVMVQLFVAVTVKVYMPGTVTFEGFCTVEIKPEGPVQAKLGLLAVDVPLMVIVGVPQVTVPPWAPASGGIVLPVTTVVAVLVQPLVPVTVRV